MKPLLDADRSLANARSETDARGTYPLHVAAEFGQASAARLLLDYGADVTLLDCENDAIDGNNFPMPHWRIGKNREAIRLRGGVE